MASEETNPENADSSQQQASSAETKTVLNEQEKELFVQAEDQYLKKQYECKNKITFKAKINTKSFDYKHFLKFLSIYLFINYN
jgi:hypothetical protein